MKKLFKKLWLHWVCLFTHEKERRPLHHTMVEDVVTCKVCDVSWIERGVPY